MACNDSLVALQQIAVDLRELKELIHQRLSVPAPPLPVYRTQFYDTLCSTIGTARKGILADDATIPPDAKFTRMTLKVRAMATNTYIAFGTSATPALRFTANLQTYTFEAPIMNGSIIPFKGADLSVIGDGANGVIEIEGFVISEVKSMV